MFPISLANLKPKFYLSREPLFLDFETTAIEKGTALNKDNRLLLACWKFRGKRKHKFGPEYDQQELLDDIKKAGYIVAHNAKFELQWLKRCGLDLHDVLCYDTMLGEWVLGGNLSRDLALDDTATRYGLQGKLDLVSRLIKMGVDPEAIPQEWLLEYCQLDVDLCESIFKKQVRLIKEGGLLHIQMARCLLTCCLADIEFNGLTLDKDLVEEEYVKVSSEHKELSKQLQDLTGGINLRSNKQVAELLYDKLGFKEPTRRGAPDRTAGGNRKVNAETIAGFRAGNAKQREFLDAYKRVAKCNARLTKSLNFFKEVCNSYDCTFYGVFNQGVTDTHRLSSSGRKIQITDSETLKLKEVGVQLQNIPREYKGLFKAKEDGWLVAECDAAQLEFRVAADLGNDSAAYEMIASGGDVHMDTVQAYAKAGETITRQVAKANTFQPLFGGNGNTQASRAYAEFFRTKYSGIYNTQRGWVNEVLKTKKLRTPYGMIFYWPDTQLRPDGYITNTTSIFNYAIQGFATAEIIPLALVLVWHMSRDLRVKVCATIHDSVMAEVHPDDEPKFKEICSYAFTKGVYKALKMWYNYQFKVPLGVGYKVDTHWGKGPEYTAQVFPDKQDEEIVWKVK